MDVNKGRFITINTDDGFNLAGLLGQTAFTIATARIVNMEQGVAYRMVNHVYSVYKRSFLRK
jgi:hypothetical protein